MGTGDAPRARDDGHRTALGGGVRQAVLGLTLEVPVGVVLDRAIEGVVRVDRRPAGDRERKTYAG